MTKLKAIVLAVLVAAIVWGAGSFVASIKHPRPLPEKSPATDLPARPAPVVERLEKLPPVVSPAKSTPATTNPSMPSLSPTELHRRSLIRTRREFTDKHKATDECSRLLERVARQQVTLDNTSLRALTRSVLKELDVPVSSQLLVFSGSASQGTRVNPRNPRAIYFNDECYVGVVPGGLLEMIGVDAEAGAKLYTFQDVGRSTPPTTTGADTCLGCHGGLQSGYAPGFFIRFSFPEMSGRMTNFRNATPGHDRPLDERFGGWFVTSSSGQVFPSAGQIMEAGIAVPTHIGEHYDPDSHLARSSDILAHLLHEHQIGFHNRLIKVLMSARDNGQAEGEQITASHSQDVEELVKYMLFCDEAKLPKEGISGAPDYVEDFRRNRRPSRTGASLKDLELHSRLFKYRCSYMIYTRPWREMPAEIKAEQLTRLHRALQSPDDPLSAHLPEFERLQILHILRDTVPDLPDDW